MSGSACGVEQKDVVPGLHTLIRQQKNEQLKDERPGLRIAALPPQPHRHTLNSGPHMTNAQPVIIQQQVC